MFWAWAFLGNNQVRLATCWDTLVCIIYKILWTLIYKYHRYICINTRTYFSHTVVWQTIYAYEMISTKGPHAQAAFVKQQRAEMAADVNGYSWICWDGDTGYNDHCPQLQLNSYLSCTRTPYKPYNIDVRVCDPCCNLWINMSTTSGHAFLASSPLNSKVYRRRSRGRFSALACSSGHIGSCT